MTSENQKVTRIVVNLKRQRLFAYHGDRLIYDYDCATGKAGKETHPGKFKIFRRHKDYTSKTYDVPMNYAMFFTEDGKAIHESTWVFAKSYAKFFGADFVGSQGCVGLQHEDAKELFEATPMHTPVEVVSD